MSLILVHGRILSILEIGVFSFLVISNIGMLMDAIRTLGQSPGNEKNHRLDKFSTENIHAFC